MTLITRTLRALAILSSVSLCAFSLSASVAISTASPLPAGTVSAPYSAQLAATGGTAPYTWTVSSCSGSCNTGLASPGFATSGKISGTPVNAGTSTFGFTVKDATGKTATKSVSITIAPQASSTSSTPTISTTSLPTGTVAVPYSATLSAKGGTSPYAWTIASCSGACNTGLSRPTATGVISGTPANAGTSTFGLTVKDATGKTASANLVLTIVPANSTAVSVNVTPATAVINTGKTQQFSASITGSSNTAATWYVNGVQGGSSTTGTISATGLYTAPTSVPSGGAATIMAKSVADTTKSATATVSILASSTPVSVSITPTTASLTTTQTKQFSATVTGSTNTGISWMVNNVTGGNSTVGTVSSNGLYSAPSTVPSGGSVTVTAVSSYDSTKSATATVSIAAGTTSTSPANYLYVSPTGSNSNPCTQASPCATPDYAFNTKATAGETVQVAPGTYSYGGSAMTLSKSGTSGQYRTLTCATPGACKITNSVTGNAAVVVLSGSYITFDGFEVTNSGSGNNLGLYITASNQNITRNTIHHIETDCGSNGGGGVQVAGSGSTDSGISDITLDSNTVYDISWTSCQGSKSVQTDGILAETAGTGLRVTNNIVYHVAGGWGILVGNANNTNASVNTVIQNNTVFSNGNGGIILMSGNGSTISNNIVTNNGLINAQCGINAPSGVTVTYANNDLYGNAGGNYCIEWGGGSTAVKAGDISVNPASGTTFVKWATDGTGDYHSKAGSPAIDAGSNINNFIKTDHDGNPRPKGSAYDIGAYEYQQ